MMMGRSLLLAAAAALLAAPGARAEKLSFDDLVANLKSPNASTRVSAAQQLGQSRRREAVAPLSALVRDDEPKVRLEVVRALRSLRDLSAVPALVSSLQDGDAGIREEATGTLVELYSERERSGPAGRFLQGFSDEDPRAPLLAHVPVDPSVYEGLARLLRDEQRSLRAQAAFALGLLDGRPALRDLTAALQDPVADVRGAAVSAIGKVGGPEDGRPVIALLTDESGDVRARAVRALGALRTTEAGPALRETYDGTRHRETGLKVLDALARVGDPAQADFFKKLLQDSSDPERKRLAVEGLARISDTGSLPGFKKDFQRTRDEELRLALAFAAARLGDPAFVDSLVLCLASRTLARRCQDYLVELGPTVLPELYPYLSDPDAEVRATLCDVMGSLGQADAVEKLAPLIQDPSSKVADRANRAVERLKRGSER